MAITLNGIQEKVRALEGKPRTTPIRMSDLNNRINNLEQRGQYKFVTYPDGTFRAKIPDECINWNWRIIGFTIEGKKTVPDINFGQYSISIGNRDSGSTATISFEKSGDLIIFGYSKVKNLTILFYV